MSETQLALYRPLCDKNISHTLESHKSFITEKSNLLSHISQKS